jgi:hypothetical protein
MYWLGLIIVAIAMGHRYEQIDGWLVLGGGMMFYGFIVGLYNTILVFIKRLKQQ